MGKKEGMKMHNGIPPYYVYRSKCLYVNTNIVTTFQHDETLSFHLLQYYSQCYVCIEFTDIL